MKTYKIALMVGALTVAGFAGGMRGIVRAEDSNRTPKLGSSVNNVGDLNKASKPKASAIIDTACVQTSIDTRDNAVIAAVDAFHTSAVTALQTRRDALKAAWGMTDKTARNAASKAAWSAYSTSVRAARKTLSTARRAAWSQFRTDRKTCKAPSADWGGEGMDVSL